MVFYKNICTSTQADKNNLYNYKCTLDGVANLFKEQAWLIQPKTHLYYYDQATPLNNLTCG